MEDTDIITLFFERSENAVKETQKKYGAVCERIAFNILENSEDSEEAVNDTLMRAWNTIPPQKPKSLGAYLTVIVRNISLDIYRKRLSYKRQSERMTQTLDETAELLPDDKGIESRLDGQAITDAINRFLHSQPRDKRILFVRRYYYFDSIKQLSERFDLTESYITVTLMRMRKKLKQQLSKEGLI
ncbi:MAG: sigma-70 family RNA polymerase sigma factor [Ruminococcus sp.]|nr:sigma-70 family RNA polymerase sigma factor [Ruminococcus sp.]